MMQRRLGLIAVGVVIGVIAAIGFSVGLFMANELIAPGQVRAETSMGVLLTLLAVPLALLSAKMLSVGRFGRARV